MSTADTIFALSTPPGRAGVAVVRVSGDGAWDSAAALFTNPLTHRMAAYGALINPATGDVIDRTLVLPFKAPASFTGEDTVEYHLHGSAAVIAEMIEVLSAQEGHRMAEPGEFTRRAFENDKMDLTEAEAIADLIDAQTQAQKIQALAQMEGSLSRLYNDWTDRLTKALAHCEADIEFPDEDIAEDLPSGLSPQITHTVRTLEAEIASHLNDNRRGERLRDGLHVAVVGAPNAGKSSLVNALAQRDVAIVSDMAGTTRDIIEAHMDLGGFPVILSDTAGLRPDQMTDDAQDKIESEGIKRALDLANAADIRLLVFDATTDRADSHTLALVDDNTIIVVNKMDEATAIPADLKALEATIVELSASTGQGLEALIQTLITRVQSMFVSRESVALTRQRHRTALQECHEALNRALHAALPELMAEDMRLAIRAIGRITGKVDVEDLLDVVFNDFCIGK